MLVRLMKFNKKVKHVILVCLFLGMIFNFHAIDGQMNIPQSSQAGADFFLQIITPSEMEYWEEVNITIEVREISNLNHQNLSINITLEKGLFFAEEEVAVHDLGDFNQLEEKNTSFIITGSQTFLTNPIVLYKVYLHKDGVRLDIDTQVEGQVYTLQYGIGSMTVQFPILKVDSSPLEIEGFVVPRISLLNNQEQTLTYNISNEGVAALRNLTFRVEVDENVLELTSTVLRGNISGKMIENVSLSSDSFPSLNLFPGNSHILFEINVLCITPAATDHSRVYLFISSDFFDTKEYSVKVQTFDLYNPYQYDNPLVFFAWPLYILFFTILAIAITIYSWKKHVRRAKKAAELEARYGASYVSCD